MKSKSTVASRRGFLKTAAGISGSVAAVVALGSSAATNDDATEPASVRRNGSGYQLSAHVREYYQKARF